MNTSDATVGDLEEPPGTVLMGSMNKRAYLFLCMSAERMAIERENAHRAGVQDVRDFVFVLDGVRLVLSYEELRARLFQK